MKNIMKLLILTLFIAGIVLPFACKKDNNNGGDPEISRIRAISASPNDSVLHKAGPGQTVVIQGDHLATTLEIYFNDYPSPFNSALLTDENVVVTVPADMPFADLDPAKLNTIRLVTKYGEITYNFPIQPELPSVEYMTSEVALPGNRVTIYGANFFFVQKVTFPPNIEVTTDLVANKPGTTLEVTVPAGVTKGPIKVATLFGTGTSYWSFNDPSQAGTICNFDDINTVNNWAGAPIIDDASLYPNNQGKYVRLKYDNLAGGDAAWWQGGRSVNIEENATTHPMWVPAANINDAPANWAVKFEINTKVGWKGGILLVDRNYGWNYQARVAPWATAAGGEYKSNGWKTITIPLSNFKKDLGLGTPITKLSEFLPADGSGGLNLFFVNNHTGNAAVDAVDVAVDNIRVVRLR
jgi:hypothetical protein